MATITSLVAAHGPMRIGMSGPPVQIMQQSLALLGYPLKGTGYFGNATDTAVEAYQKSRKLIVDGEVGVLTARAIDADVLARVPPGTNPPTIPVLPVADAARPLWLQAALNLIGTKEVAGAADNPKIIEWARELGGNIAADYRRDSIPWCALFVGHCLALAGEKGTGTLWALDYASWGVRLAVPAIGAIASMARSGGGHVAIVVGKDRGGLLACVGGNQSDAVNIRSFPVSRIKAFTWPKDQPLPDKVGMASLPVVRSDGTSARES